MDKPKPRSDMHRTAVEEIRIMAYALNVYIYECSPQGHCTPNIRMQVGLPDLAFFYALGKVGYCEVKVGKDHLSERQKEFRDIALNWGIPYLVCNGGDQFAEDIADLRR